MFPLYKITAFLPVPNRSCIDQPLKMWFVWLDLTWKYKCWIPSGRFYVLMSIFEGFMVKCYPQVQKMCLEFAYGNSIGIVVGKCLLMESITVTHWGRVTHICVGELTIIASDNGFLLGRRQAIIWTNAAILLIGYKLQWNLNRNLNIFKRTWKCSLQNAGQFVSAPVC